MSDYLSTNKPETDEQRLERIIRTIAPDGPGDSDAQFLIREIRRLKAAITAAMDSAEEHDHHLHKGTDEPRLFYEILTKTLEGAGE